MVPQGTYYAHRIHYYLIRCSDAIIVYLRRNINMYTYMYTAVLSSMNARIIHTHVPVCLMLPSRETLL